MTDLADAPSPNGAKAPRLGYRHVVVVLISLGLAALYAMRSNLSVALVAMVNVTAIPPLARNTSSVPECPGPSSASANGSSKPPIPPGPFPWPRDIQGFILSSFYWGYIVTQVPAGVLARRVGGKWILGAGTAWAVLLTALTPLIARQGPFWFIGSRVLRGIGEGFTYPAVSALLGRWVPREESSFLFIVANVGMQVGTIAGQLGAGPLCASDWRWPSVFYLSAAMAAAWLLSWTILGGDSPGRHWQVSDAERQWIESSTREPHSPRKSGVPWRAILCDPAVWAYTYCTFVNSWKTYLLLTCLPQFLSDVLHFDIRADGLISTLPYVGNLVVQLLASSLADRVIRARVASRTLVRKTFTTFGQLSVSGFMVAVTFVGCSPVATVAMLVCMLTFQGFDAGGFLPNALDLSPDHTGVLFGIANTFGIAAGILAPVITDLITVRHSRAEWRLVFVTASAVAASAALVFAVFGSGQRREWSKGEEDEEALVEDGDLAHVA